MAAMTVEETTRVTANNKQGMATLLEDKAEAHTWRDRIASAPKALKGYVAAVFKWMRLNKVKDTFGGVYDRGRELLITVFGPVRKIGLFNIVGALLTCKGGRDILRSVGRTAYRIVSAPVRFAGRALGWIGRHIGLGSAVDWVDRQYHNAVNWAADKIEAGMTWLDEREHSGAMRWARPYFQGAIGSRLIRHYAPANLKTPLYIANLFVPTIGVGAREGDGLTTESKLEVIKDAAETAKSEVEEKLDEATKKDNVTPMPANKEVVEEFHGTIVGTGKKTRYQRITKMDGTIVYRWQGREYSEAEIPQHVKLVDAVAETTPEPPMNRAARREAEKANAAKS